VSLPGEESIKKLFKRPFWRGLRKITLTISLDLVCGINCQYST